MGRVRGRGAGGSLVRRRMGPPCSRAAFDHPVRVPTPEGFSNPTTPEVSPDGRKVVFAAGDNEGKRQIWIRTLDTLEPRPLTDAEVNTRPFWAPDSRSIGFVIGGKLKKQDIAGGPPQTICDAPTGSDGTWSTDGVILFDGRSNDPILRVPAAGGVAKPEVIDDPKNGTATPGWPMFLPDGRHFLFTRNTGTDQAVVAGTLDSHEIKPLFKATSRVLYAEPGYCSSWREHAGRSGSTRSR